MTKRFDELFNVKNGVISPKATIQINGITMGPGVSFSGGVSFGGVDLFQFIGREFLVDVQNGIYVIRGIVKT